MSQPTDITQPMVTVDPEDTVETPIILPPTVAPAVPVVPPLPAFNPVRARLMHLHRVLGRILSTAALPTPDRADMHAYGNGIELLVHTDLDGSALGSFAAVFGGTPTHEDRESKWSESGMQRYAELLTVIDGVEVRVWSLTDLPAAEKPVPEPVAEPVAETPAEPQPEPAPAPEAPAETPEAA